MMVSTAYNPVCGMLGTISEGVATGAAVAAGTTGDGTLGELISLYRSNSYLFSELKSVRLKLVRARDYLAAPGCNRVLGESHLLRLRARHSAVLVTLRANRLQARGLLARAGGAGLG